MPLNSQALIVFTDLDGCLLNKHDYDWSAAASTLDTLRQRQIPVIMNSSKTVSEMMSLGNELGLAGNTFISENGSVIRWGNEFDPDGCFETEVIGATQNQILEVLGQLKQQFQFRSFADLGLLGVVKETQLPEEKALMAFDRLGTQPLLWDDTTDRRSDFEQALLDCSLSLTQGGRFWHVAGQTSKGKAMRRVALRMHGIHSATGTQPRAIVAAIGDSPIDQSMLDLADVPIGIPTSTGLGVDVDPERGLVASKPGAAGWAEVITQLLSQIDAGTYRTLDLPPP